MKRRRWRWMRAAALVLPIVLLCASVFARAGDGGGYGGGGGGGSGGGGGDGGAIFWLVIQLIRLAIYYPAVGVPLLIIIVIAIIAAQRKGTNLYQTSVIRRGSSLIGDNDRALMLARLRQSDPAFDQTAFYNRVAAAFVKIQQAWANQNLQAVRPFISDAVFERFNLQFDEQRALGYRNAMENVAVDDVALAQVRSDHLFDELSVRIEASANDFNVSLADGSRMPGSDDSGTFAEIWSFLRRRGVQTDSSKSGLIEGNCPNCGAAVEMNQNANCVHCGAMLRSGQYDWVLAEITQESEWVASQRTEMSSVNAMIERDPDFNLQELEDRASVMFWRRAAAERIGRVAPLRKIASSEFVADAEAGLKMSANKPREYFGECAVGSVDTLGIIADEEWDRALVEVRWAGTAFFIKPGDARPQNMGRSTLSRTVLELSRKSGVKSDAGKAISSAHCPHCGAPESGRDDATSGACEFCGTVLNDGKRTWVLTALRTPAEAREMLASSHRAESALTPSGDASSSGASLAEAPHNGSAPPPTATALAWMIKMALTDGRIDPGETELLSRVALRRNVPRTQLDTLIAAAQHGQIDLPMPSRREEVQQWLGSMAEAAMADGKLSRDEYALLQSAGQHAGLAQYDLNMLVKRVRAEAYTSAKTALRQSRRGTDDRPA